MTKTTMSLNEWVEKYKPILSTDSSLISNYYHEFLDFWQGELDEKRFLKQKEEIDKLMEHFNDAFKYIMDYNQACQYPIQHRFLVETFPHFLKLTQFFVVTRKPPNDFSNVFIVSSDGNYKIKLSYWSG